MMALTFGEFKETCPAREDCKEPYCHISKSMCQHLYKEAIGPHLARQMREEANDRTKHKKGSR